MSTRCPSACSLLSAAALLWLAACSNGGASSANFTPNTATAVGATYTLAQVATHSGRSDCWTAINGNVYNVTAWATRHPGGDQNIYRLCGIDGSSAFTGQHGDQGEPNEVLAEYQVGTLS